MSAKHSTIAMALADNVTIPLENAFLKIGIDSSWKAGLLVGAVTAGALYAAKPDISFDPQTGEARPWIFFYEPQDSTKSKVQPTYMPFWLSATLVGFAFSLVI